MRVLVFDKPGPACRTGMSDRFTEPPHLEARMDDVRAVRDAAGVERAPLRRGDRGTGSATRLEIRAGLHAGEVAFECDDLVGLDVSIAARIGATASPN
jgi:class 3 adenylate cyclase